MTKPKRLKQKLLNGPKAFKLDNDLGPNYGPQYCTHALTLTYKDIVTFKEAKRQLKGTIERFKRSLICVFYAEYTEQGNIHWHGIIHERSKPVYNKFLFHWRHFYGFTYESKLTDRIAWHYYCIKGQRLFKNPLLSRVTTKRVLKREAKSKPNKIIFDYFK